MATQKRIRSNMILVLILGFTAAFLSSPSSQAIATASTEIGVIGGNSKSPANLPTIALYATIDSLGNLVITESGGNTDDSLSIHFDGANFNIETNNTLSVNDISGASGDGSGTLIVPASDVPGSQVIINTQGGDDTLTIKLENGKYLGKAITFNGGGQTSGDDLILIGRGTFTSAAFGFINENDGTIDINGNSHITYTGLEPISANINATNITLNYSTSTETITILNPGSGQTTVDSNVGGEMVTFNNPIGTLRINAGDTGDDVISVTSLAPNYPAALILDGQGGNDTININIAVSTNGENVELFAENVNISEVLGVGSGSITLNTDAISIGASVSGTSMLTITPQTNNTSIGLGGGSGDLHLTDTELGLLQDGFNSITIGNSDSGNITVDSATFLDPLTLITGGNIVDASSIGTDLTAISVTFDGILAPSSPDGTFAVSGDVTFADNSSLAVDLTGDTPTGLHDRITATGSMTIGSSVVLTLTPLGYTHQSGTITIIENGSGAVSGTFDGLVEGSQTNPGGPNNFLINYANGDGNDVTLTAASPTAIKQYSFTVKSGDLLIYLALISLVLVITVGTVFLRKKQD